MHHYFCRIETHFLTVVLDGFGYREEEYGNAIKMAETKNFDRLWETYPHTTLFTLVSLPSVIK